MLPAILNQLPTESLAHLKERIVGASTGQGAPGSIPLTTTEEDDEVPDLVENFDEPSKKEAPTVETKPADAEAEPTKAEAEPTKAEAEPTKAAEPAEPVAAQPAAAEEPAAAEAAPVKAEEPKKEE